jgi:CheY-like chemotaxis protein
MKTILQVEDDPNDVFLFQHAMKKAGLLNPIQVAIDGQQAIDYLQGAGKFADREKYPFPCLVLLDLKLPYVMGLEVLKSIRRQHGMALTVLMLTASGEEADILTAYRLGANGFLTKPSEASKLQGLVKAIGDFWLNHNVLPRELCAESPTTEVVNRVPPTTTDLAPKCERTNGKRREERPHNVKIQS